MADNSDILKEYLVALGFKIDQNGLNKLDSALGKTTKVAASFAGILIGAATAATAFVDKVATKMEDLYWTSVQLRDGAANIQDFRLQLSKVGVDGDHAVQAVSSLAAYLRTNPAGEGWLHQIGVQTRDAAGEMRSAIDIGRDFARLPQPWWLKVRLGQRLGLDEETIRGFVRADEAAAALGGRAQPLDRIGQLYKRAGINADDASEKSKDFKNQLRDLGAIGDVLGVVLESRLLPAVRAFVGLAAAAAGWLIDLDNLTGGFSTDVITLTGVIWGLNAAMSVAFGGSIIKMLAGIALWVATLTATAFPALSGAILAIGAAIEATPIGWIITAIALVGAAAFLVIRHWDKVKEYFTGFVSWLRDKYNAVAKYLGLPTWEAPKRTEPPKGEKPGSSPTAGARDGEQPDFRAIERNLGPNSLYGAREGAAAGGDQGQGAAITGKALAFFEKAGWSAQQAAGIVANLVHESQLNPSAKGDSGAAFGIAQWHPDRQAAFKGWAGKDIHESNLDEQMAFVHHELTQGAEKFAGKMLAGATNAAQAAAAVSKYYERPLATGSEMRLRADTAETIYDNSQHNTAVDNSKKIDNSKRLIANSKLAPPAPTQNKNITVNQKTEIKVSGSDAQSTGRAVAREQGRVNGDLARNFAGAAS